MKRLMVDLCCGLRGASAAARDRGWRVICLDINPIVAPGVLGDLRALPLRPQLRPDLLWISPPCQEFTMWRLPWSPNTAPVLGVELMRAAVAARDYLQPRFWVIENVPAAAVWVREFLGEPSAKVHAHVFWSNLFALLPRLGPHKERIAGHCKFTHWKRSLIDYSVSQAFVTAAEAASNEVGRSLGCG